MIRKAVIPAAGLGTRLLPATKSQPKEMLPVGRKPVIQYVVEELAAAGIKDILIITGHKKRSIEDHFDEDPTLQNASPELCPTASSMHVQLFYVRQSVPLGLGHAVNLAKDFTGDEDFVVALGDSIIHAAKPHELLIRMMKCHRHNSAAATIALERVSHEDVGKYGIAALEDDSTEVSRIIEIVEKPQVGEAPSNCAVAARYIFSPQIYGALSRITKGYGGEYQLTDAIQLLIRDGLPVFGVMLRDDEKRLDIGGFDTYFEAFFLLALTDPELGKHMLNWVKRWLQVIERQCR
ncbi:MAG: UTP--glucose-1-phosphate uridylyltransferase [Armatimonadota bacterium]|nr:UTP--glucose-1-phosphate uridylyltransferase [Armatimonadota bacterium]MCX7776965.1 UTP--glucose-1-phosphate uridylyltransferase [Armatimonadota bacterium]MDW8024799.1 UTP--glucose-1-phosphate uridylyltransferase [Armatimonadota bacterium]